MSTQEITPAELSTHPFDVDDDHLKEECGVFGIVGDADAAAHTALGLHALQHRGQEAAGIVAFDGVQFHSHRGMGHVSENFTSEVVDRLKGHMAVGHTRYATTGGTILRNVQPLFAELEFGGFALAHNGNLTNALTLRSELQKRGSLFQSTSDTEVVTHLIALSQQHSVEDRLIDALRQIEGAYSFVCLTNSAVIGARDPLGVRPLVLGKLDKSHILCSETCALDIIGAEYVRDIEPGEVVILAADGSIRSLKPFPKQNPRFCIFEYIYFARPDSDVEHHNVYDVRKKIGAQLAFESPVDCDVVVPVPDSGVPAALGFAAQAGKPFEYGIIRNHYVGRTFIQPTDKTRHLGVKRKHNPNKGVLAGKRVVLVDDSIVRGTTSTKIVEMVRQAGATEVHMRISSPPTAHPCFFGIDTPSYDKLLAARHDVASMAKLLGVDSLAFISIDGLYKAVGQDKRSADKPQYCDACFTGDYPLPLTDQKAGSQPKQLSLLQEERAS